MGKKMSMKTSLLCLLLILPIVLDLPDHPVIGAQIGQTVILPCSYQNNSTTPVLVLRWNQTNIQAEDENDYVLLNREGSLVADHQLHRFQGRVELQDLKLENGNFNLILKKVTKADNGTYECKVFLRTEIISLTNISLIVGEQDKTKEEPVPGNQTTVGLSLLGILGILGIVATVVYKC